MSLHFKDLDELIQDDEFLDFIEKHCEWEFEETKPTGIMRCGSYKSKVILKCKTLSVSTVWDQNGRVNNGKEWCLKAMALLYIQYISHF